MNRLQRIACTLALPLVAAVAGLSPADTPSDEIRQGHLAVTVMAKGTVTDIAYDGTVLLSEHPGGFNLIALRQGQTQGAYIPQSYNPTEAGGTFQTAKTSDGKTTTLVAKGTYQFRAGYSGTASVVYTTVIGDDTIRQSAVVESESPDLVAKAGGAIWVKGSQFSPGCFQANDDAFKALPPSRGNRNLVWPKTAEKLVVMSPRYRLDFAFTGAPAFFFDDRHRDRLTVEFATVPKKVTDARGQVRYRAEYGLTLKITPNAAGTLPVKALASATDGPATPIARIDLKAPKRLIEKTPFRAVYSLDGTWDWVPLGTYRDFPESLFKTPAPQGGWKPTDVPTKVYPQPWSGKQHAAWFRVAFTPPADLAGRRVVLDFDEISFDARYFLNGQYLARSYGGYAPVEVDVTKAIRPGVENRLEIFIGDETAALEPSRFPRGLPENLPRSAIGRDTAIAPFYCASKGILRPVRLVARPDVSIADIAVRTSVRQKRIEAEVTVRNDTKRMATVYPGATVVKRLADDQAGPAVLTLPREALTVPPGGECSVTLAADWADPQLWDVKQPNLYFMDVTLYDGPGDDAKALDTRRQRFGFREFWMQGPDFYLNGRKIRLRECATHIYYHPGTVFWDKEHLGKLEEGARKEFQAILDMNCNATRLVHRPHPPLYYDVADELGLLTIAHMPFGFAKSEFDLEHPQTLGASRAVVERLVRRDRNHPSIVIWEAENEGFPYGVEDNAERWADFYKRTVIDVCAAIDPTRPVKAGGDGDLMGRAGIVDMHGGDHPDRHDLPLPNSNWTLLDGSPTRPYGYVGGTAWRWGQDKPLYLGEGLYWMFDDDKSKAARFIGEAVYDDPVLGDQWYRGQQGFLDTEAVYFRIGIPIWRMFGNLAGYCPWAVAPGFGVTLLDKDLPTVKVVTETMKPEIVFQKELYTRFFGGSPFFRDLCVINDSASPQEYRLEISADMGGHGVFRETYPVSVAPAGTAWRKVAFTLPEVQVKTAMVLKSRLVRADGSVADERQWDFAVYPHRTPALPAGMVLGVYDPAGATAALLKGWGVAFTAVEGLDRLPAGLMALVVGQDAFKPGDSMPVSIDAWVAHGGRCLILSQSQAVPFGPMQRDESQLPMTRSFVFPSDPASPLLTDITAGELIFWNHPDWDRAHSVTRQAREKYRRGNVHAVLECDDLWYAPLQEVRYGAGLYVECAMDIVDKAASEPVVEQLWQNLLTRMASFKADYRPLSVLGDAGLVEALRGQGIEATLVDAVPADGILAVTASSPSPAAAAEAIKPFVEKGNTLWLISAGGLSPDVVSALADVTVKTQPYPSAWNRRAVRRTVAGRASEVLAGITSVVIYDRKAVPNLWTVTGEGVTELATGGAIVEIARGKGSILLDRIAWQSPGSLREKRWMEHYLHALVTNLGGRIDLNLNAQRRVYKPEDFIRLDLRKVVNRGFRDETSGDGKGGWTDQGPANDLRGIEPGVKQFHRIPFTLIDPAANDGQSCLVLASPHAPGCPAETDAIPVDAKASKLFFLQTAAWFSEKTHGGKPVIHYDLTYDDGSKATVDAVGGDDVLDWWSPRNAGKSRGVVLTLKSDTEADAAPRRRGLFLQEADNPHPGKAIRSLRIRSANAGPDPDRPSA